jgi:hypothetical protein
MKIGLRLIAGAVLASAVLLAGESRAQMVELKFGHVGEPGSLFALSAE